MYTYPISKTPTLKPRSLGILLVTLCSCGFSLCSMRHLRRAAADTEGVARERYERDATEFAHVRQMLESDEVAWTHRAVLNLRTGCSMGAAVWPVAGDPYYRAQRVFVIVLQVLLSMVLDIIITGVRPPVHSILS